MDTDNLESNLCIHEATLETSFFQDGNGQVQVRRRTTPPDRTASKRPGLMRTLRAPFSGTVTREEKFGPGVWADVGATTEAEVLLRWLLVEYTMVVFMVLGVDHTGSADVEM